jgi:2-polyprenyl-3-methyl-5-hydroxy-6-metoxy-1,4-benzoquinol methylase
VTDPYMPLRCPICSASCDKPPVFTYSVREAATHFCPPWRDESRCKRLEHSIRALWGKESCDIVRCNACGFAFGVPFVGGDENFYGILHECYGYPGWRWEYSVALSILDGLAGPILDVGAGKGVFLAALDRHWEPWAAESSDRMREILRARGISVLSDLTSAVAHKGQYFGAITMFQVLEHIATFRPVLTACRALLRPGGRLVITVPDCDAMLRQPALIGEHDMPPNHINKFTPKSLDLLLREHGFQIERVTYEPPSWKKVGQAIHGRLRADATDPNTLAARIYRTKSRRVRIPLLMLAGITTVRRLFPHVRELRQGGAFMIVGSVRS